MNAWIVGALLLLSGCGESSSPDGGADGTMDAALAQDGGASGDEDAGASGDAGASEDAGASDDAGAIEDAGDGGPPVDVDAGGDAGASEDAGLGPVMCRTSADCAEGQFCDRDVPGGRCTSCLAPDSCLVGECFFSVCQPTCEGSERCNAGMVCASINETRYCRPRDCADCPAPYVCRDDKCSRPLCDASGTCPDPLVCDGTVCVEP